VQRKPGKCLSLFYLTFGGDAASGRASAAPFWQHK